MEKRHKINTQDSNTIQVNMLGEFSISIGGITFTDSSARTYQLTNLMEYLIAFRTKTISHAELVGVLWPDESSESPVNALKNLVYRVRTTLASKGFPLAKKIIVLKNGCYSWNNNLPCVVDIEEFENLYKRAVDVNLPEEQRIELYFKAIKIYKGHFLSGSCYEEWVINLAQYYHSLFLKCVYEVIALLEKAERYDDVKSICEKAILMDRFEESVHRHLMFAMHKMGNNVSALSYYQHITNLFYSELGVKLSPETRDIYSRILKSIRNDEKDLFEIKQELIETDTKRGAFVCDYEIFKNIYQHQARNVQRSGEEIFIGLFTIINENGGALGSKEINDIMANFLEVLRNNVRSSDVVSRYSLSQFVIMLPRITYENANMVMDRIVNKFNQNKKDIKVKIILSAQPITVYK